MERQRFNYKSLSLAAGLGETTVRDIMIGRARNPRRDTLQKIARTLGMPLSYFLTESESVQVMGLGEPSKRPAGVREHERSSAMLDFVELPPEAGYRALKAVRLRGDELMPFLSTGSVLYYDEGVTTEFDACLGKLCIASIAHQGLGVGVLKPSALYGRYDLAGYAGHAQKDLELEWCSKVIFIKQA